MLIPIILIIILCYGVYSLDRLLRVRGRPQYPDSGFVLIHNDENDEKFLSDSTTFDDIKASSFECDSNFLDLVYALRKKDYVIKDTVIMDSLLSYNMFSEEYIKDRMRVFAMHMHNSLATRKFFKQWKSPTPYNRFIIRKKSGEAKCMVGILRNDGKSLETFLFTSLCASRTN